MEARGKWRVLGEDTGEGTSVCVRPQRRLPGGKDACVEMKSRDRDERTLQQREDLEISVYLEHLRGAETAPGKPRVPGSLLPFEETPSSESRVWGCLQEKSFVTLP